MRFVCLLMCLCMPLVALAQEFPEDPPDSPATSPPTLPGKSTLRNRFYAGGWLGASFGDVVSTVQVAPELGFIVVPKLHLGGSLVYRYRKDKRFEPDLSTTDIGGSLYGRYFVYAPIFLQAGVEQLNWDYIATNPDGEFDTINTDHTAILVGPGLALPLGPSVASYMTFLYDVNYDDEGPNPYDRPWMIRFGVGVGL